LIINHLSIKTHENTGNKPAKPEMNNKPNMTPNHSTAICKSVAGLPLNTVNLFQDDTHPTSCKSYNPVNPDSDKKPTGNCIQPAKTNTIDHQ
jgi:hypothetical protein